MIFRVQKFSFHVYFQKKSDSKTPVCNIPRRNNKFAPFAELLFTIKMPAIDVKVEINILILKLYLKNLSIEKIQFKTRVYNIL